MQKPKTPLTRSQQMARVKSKNTSFEIMLGRELWRRGLRYRANDKTVFGKPDIVFKGKKSPYSLIANFGTAKIIQMVATFRKRIMIIG